MYLSNKIYVIRRNNLQYSDIESIWIEVIWKCAKTLLICGFHRPLSCSKYLPNKVNISTKGMLTIATTEHKEIIIMGDVNLNYLVTEDNNHFKDIFDLMALNN